MGGGTGRRSSMCEWGECQSYDTPIGVTVPDNRTNGTRRVHFCCLDHLASWAIKERLKAGGKFAGTRNHEQAIEAHVKAPIGTGLLTEKTTDVEVVKERPL